MNEIKKIIGITVLSLRRKNGWTQQQVADKSGISRASISLIEIGKDSPGLENAYKLAMAFDVEIHEILPNTIFYFPTDD